MLEVEKTFRVLLKHSWCMLIEVHEWVWVALYWSIGSTLIQR